MPAKSPKTTILIVEDDAQLRALYRTALTAAGFAAVAVEDGLDALNYVEHVELPDAVVLDLGLPRLRGRDVYRELSAAAGTSRIPIIVVTGEPQGSFDEREFACVLRKPVDMDGLVESVRSCLRNARSSG